MRTDGRAGHELRSWKIEPGYISNSLGAALVTSGKTRVICTANAESRAPAWLERGGWVTAEYAMLPGATAPRGRRDPGGRGKEIQRLIGRSLRAAVELDALVGVDGPVSIICDCDVIEADGGTRTASITGAYVALMLALRGLVARGVLERVPPCTPVAAVSVGVVAGAVMLDLTYEEDSRADVDLNAVLREGQGYVELQGTGERDTFSREQLGAMLDLADAGCRQLFAMQAEALS